MSWFSQSFFFQSTLVQPAWTAQEPNAHRRPFVHENYSVDDWQPFRWQTLHVFKLPNTSCVHFYHFWNIEPSRSNIATKHSLPNEKILRMHGFLHKAALLAFVNILRSEEKSAEWKMLRPTVRKHHLLLSLCFEDTNTVLQRLLPTYVADGRWQCQIHVIFSWNRSRPKGFTRGQQRISRYWNTLLIEAKSATDSVAISKLSTEGFGINQYKPSSCHCFRVKIGNNFIPDLP